MLRERGTLDEKLAFAFRCAVTRRPNERELGLLKELYLGQREMFQQDPDAARKFLKTGALAVPQGVDVADLAAAAATAGALLNLDAALVIR
jgi:hypothetical protein